MALIGNCKYVTYTDHETDTTNETISFPDGKEIKVEVPVKVKNEVDHSDVYLSIKQIEFFVIVEGGEKFTNIHYQYAGYTDVGTRNADQEDFLFWNTLQLQNYDHTQNLYSQIYTEIKLIEGLTNLTND